MIFVQSRWELGIFSQEADKKKYHKQDYIICLNYISWEHSMSNLYSKLLFDVSRVKLSSKLELSCIQKD